MNTTQKERFDILNRLETAGFSYHEANTLRRISMTLRRWYELECGDGNDYASWGIERDETTDIPYMVRHPHSGTSTRSKIADKEKGALARLDTLMKNHRTLTYYVQTDPRGCSLYILKKRDIKKGEKIDSIYNRGIAVY